MKVKKIIHKVYQEFQDSKKKGHKIPQLAGKYHYVFSNPRGEISLMKQMRNYNKMPDFWEIYCLNGDLFEDSRKFFGKNGKKEAIKKVKEYLGVDELSELVSKKLEIIKNGKDKRNKEENHKKLGRKPKYKRYF